MADLCWFVWRVCGLSPVPFTRRSVGGSDSALWVIVGALALSEPRGVLGCHGCSVVGVLL